MRIIPNMKIIIPCDGPQTRDAIMTALDTPGPFYIRLGRAKFPTIEDKGEFEFGKAQILRGGTDISLFTCGLMVKPALDASDALAKEGIKARVINFHTVKPIDSEAILEAATQTRRIVVCEEHSIASGVACCIDETLTQVCTAKIARVGVQNKFGQSGSPTELLEKYGLTSKDILKAAHSLLS